MHKKNIIFIALLLIIIIALHTYFSRSFDTEVQRKNSLLIVCTTSMIADAVKNVGGSYVSVKGLMGPGVDPHMYRARESDLHALADADIIFYNGLHLEGKMVDVLYGMKNYTTTVAVADALSKDDLISADEFENFYDPHIWFDIQLWIKTVTLIEKTLIYKDPAHAIDYTNNAEIYRKQLDELDKSIFAKAQLLAKEQRILVTAHDAFSYFGRAYGFTVVGLQGINTDAQPGTRDIQNLVDLIVTKKIPAIFIESSVPQRTIQAVQQATHARGFLVTIGEELYSDALGLPGSSAATYIEMVAHNTNVIVDALFHT